MKVLVIGGIAKSLVNFRRPLLAELVRRGHEVHACAGELVPPLEADIRKMGLIFHPVASSRTGLNPFHDLLYFCRLVRLLRQLRPAVVFAYTHKPVIFGLLAARACRVPRRIPLITGLGYAFIDARGLKHRMVQAVLKTLYRLALRGTETVLFQNHDDPRLFREMGLLTAGNRCVITAGSGVPLDHYRFVPPATAPIRFLLVGRLLKDKGIVEFVEAGRQLHAKYPGIHLDLVGPLDPNPAGLSGDRVRQWQGEGLITYHGATSDVRPFLESASVYVLPSYREGMPRTVLEAMAMGRPVITTDAPGCRETIHDPQPCADDPALLRGSNGFLVPVKDAAALARAMEVFIREPALIGTMGLASRHFAEKVFDVNKVNAVLIGEMGL